MANNRVEKSLVMKLYGVGWQKKQAFEVLRILKTPGLSELFGVNFWEFQMPLPCEKPLLPYPHHLPPLESAQG